MVEEVINPTPEFLALLSDMCNVFGNPHRIQIAYQLAERSLDVNHLADSIQASPSSTSRHLKVLRERGLVRSIRRGTSVEYRLNDFRILAAFDLMGQVLRDRLIRQAKIMEGAHSSDSPTDPS